MNGGTREARLSIRYPDFEIIDDIEIHANRLGIKKNAWVKEAIKEKLEADRTALLLEATRLRGDFESRKLIEMIAGPEMTKKAKAYVDDFFKRTADHASKQ